jgi:hypothetical protein
LFPQFIPDFIGWIITTDTMRENAGSAGPQIGEQQARVVLEIAPADNFLSLLTRDPPNESRVCDFSGNPGPIETGIVVRAEWGAVLP